MHPSKERRSSRSKTTTAQRIVTLPCGRSSPNSPINGSPPSQMSREGRNAHLRRGNRARKNCLPYWRKLSGGHVQEKLRSPTSRESTPSGRHACFGDEHCCGGREVGHFKSHFKSQGRARCPTSVAGAQKRTNDGVIVAV